jgi:hypothetical protein
VLRPLVVDVAHMPTPGSLAPSEEWMAKGTDLLALLRLLEALRENFTPGSLDWRTLTETLRLVEGEGYERIGASWDDLKRRAHAVA